MCMCERLVHSQAADSKSDPLTESKITLHAVLLFPHSSDIIMLGHIITIYDH